MRMVYAIASLTLLLAAGGTSAAVDWPGAAPCDTTLQACIDAQPSGGTVLVATDDPAVEDLLIAKSLILSSAPGFSPVVGGEIVLESGPAATAITVSGLAVEGPVRAIARAGDLEVHVVGNSVDSDVDNRPAVELASDPSLPSAGNLTAEVRDNDIRAMGSAPGDTCSGVLLFASTSPQAFASIEHNTIFVSGCPAGAAIIAAVAADRTVTVDVLRNQAVVPNTGVGLALQNHASGPASLDARVVGNLVRGEFFSVGVSVVDSADGTLDVQLVNNTVVDHDTGVLVIANAGTPMSGQVANNIIALNDVEGLRIDAAGVTNRNNLVFANGSENFPPGPGTIMADPQFVGGPSYHLLPGSPAIDAGADAAVPADVTLDLDGAPRIQGAAVDLGVFEEIGGEPGPQPEPIPALSPIALAVLGILLAAGGTLLLRRV